GRGRLRSQRRDAHRGDRAHRRRASGAARGGRKRGRARAEPSAARARSGRALAAADPAPPGRSGTGVGAASVAAVTREFFEGLETRTNAAKLAGLDHSYRFEIEGEGVWNVRIQAGTVVVTEGGNENGADATIRTTGEVFERLV